MEITIILIITYLISLVAAWRYVHIAHSPGGIYENLNVDVADLLLTVTPVLNTLVFAIFWLTYHPSGKRISFNKLFLIKK